MDENLKREWEEKLRSAYGDSGTLLKFLTETLDNFAYRYISTALEPNPKVVFTGQNALRARALENSMVNALKIAHPEAKEGIKRLAKSVPKAQGPTVEYSLACELLAFKADQGKLVLRARVNWGFPGHEALPENQVEALKTFAWDDLQVFRKGLPLAVQEVCDLFL